VFNWLFGKKKTKKSAKAPQKRRPGGAIPASEKLKASKRKYSDKSKSFQKTYILLNHIKQKKLLKRVRLRAKQHPKLSARLLQRWMLNSKKKQR
jgi:flagellar biosynthesis/type III secretory pathway M-ring protein FliF/YscJ